MKQPQDKESGDEDGDDEDGPKGAALPEEIGHQREQRTNHD